LVSIVFLEAWRCRHRVTLEQDSALPWLYAVARHTLSHQKRSQFRHRKALARIPIDIVDDPAEELAKRVDDQRTLSAVETAFGQLKPDDQDIIALCVWQGLEYAEAAVALEIPVGTVRSRLSRARARLAALVDPTPKDAS
ncbi:MAG: RNA polymerase sigma factor, partial [Ornithinimicrobium sp.]